MVNTSQQPIENKNKKNINDLVKDKWMSKIFIQIIFTIILVLIFFIDKVLSLINPPLNDVWYLLSFLSVHWENPYKYIKNFKITKWQS